MRSKVNIDAGGRTEVSRLFFGIGLVLALLIGLAYMRIVPMAAIAGVFMAVAFSLVDKWTRRATGVLWTADAAVARAARNGAELRRDGAGGRRRDLRLAAGGIGIGMLVAILMFIRSNSKEPVRQIVHGDVGVRARCVRPIESDLLDKHGKRIVVHRTRRRAVLRHRRGSGRGDRAAGSTRPITSSSTSSACPKWTPAARA